MILPDEKKQKIFADVKEIIDSEIEQNAYFDDTITNKLEDIMIDKLAITIDKTSFDEITDNYNNIIDLTTDFLTWLFNTNGYDKDYYNNMQYIRARA